jgi:hypothetical protein
MAAGNPVFVPAAVEAAWGRLTSYDYFDIARENRITGSRPGVIETRYRVGAACWNRGTTIRTIRKPLKGCSHSPQGHYQRDAGAGYLVGSRSSEIEPARVAGTAGATFSQVSPLRAIWT